MGEPLQMLLAAASAGDNRFPATSRYHGVETAVLERPGGDTVVYLRRRFVPPADTFAEVGEHRVAQGERLDNLAARLLGDPELFWRLCDANNAVEPGELTDRIGRRLRVTLPAGIPGGRNA